MIYNTLEQCFFFFNFIFIFPSFHTAGCAAPALSIASYSLARVRQGQSDHLCSAQAGTVEEGIKSVKKLNKKL